MTDRLWAICFASTSLLFVASCGTHVAVDTSCRQVSRESAIGNAVLKGTSAGQAIAARDFLCGKGN